MRHPRLRAGVRTVPVEPSSVTLVADGRTVPVASELAAIVPLLDGHHDVERICRAAGGAHRLPMLLGELARLEALDLLADGPPGTDDGSLLGFCDALGIEPWPSGDTVGLVDLGSPGTQEVLVALASAGTPVVTGRASVGRSRIVLVVTDDYLDDRLEELNETMLAARQPWLPVKPTGVVGWIGPLLVPSRSGCWACLAERLRRHRPLDAAGSPESPVAPQSPGALRAVAGHVVTELWRSRSLLSRTAPADGALATTLLAIDHRHPSIERHAAGRRHGCHACGGIGTEEGPPTVDGSGGDEPRPAGAVARLRPFVSPVTGVVSRVGPVGETIPGLAYSCSATFPFLPPDRARDPSFRVGHSSGKGRDPDRATLSALGEALERVQSVWRGDEQVALRDTYEAAAGRAVDPAVLFGYSEEQYETRDILAAPASRYAAVPERLRADLAIDWTEARSAAGDSSVLVPSAYCYYGHPDALAGRFVNCDSNGSAAGSSFERAVLAGFFELVERDSVALWWYNRLRRPAVDLDSAGDRHLDAVREHYAGLGRELWALDLTTDTAIPCIAAISRSIDRQSEDVTIGLGCHLDPAVALGRAVDELNQTLPIVAARRDDGSTRYRFAEQEVLDWMRSASVASDPYLLPDPAAATVRLSTLGCAATGNPALDVATCVERARAVGTDLYVVDLTRPDVPVSVVRAIAPGLRHFWRRLAPGRLYDTPVSLGWLDAPTPEADMNPRTFFF